MRGWLTAPELDDADESRRAKLLMTVLRTMFGLGAMGTLVAIVDPQNDLLVSVLFYVPVFAVMAALTALVRTGRVRLAAWVLSIFFWVLIAFVTLFFGGLHGQNAAIFAVTVMVAGSVISGRVAILLALASSLFCLFVAWLESEEKLPQALGPYTPLNAWSALTVTLVLMAVLLSTSLGSLEHMHEQAAAHARARDEALRRSVQAQKMEVVGTLASGVAHDFNNLLLVIQSSAQHLRARLAGDEGALETLADLDMASERAALITRQLLAFGRAKGGDLAAVDVVATVAELAPMLRRLLGAARELVIDTPGSGEVFATRVGIEQILLNLVVNARDAMPSGGTVTVRVRSEAQHVVLEVEDEGGGMDEATQRRALEPFFTTKEEGTGLGLATVNDLVGRFQGELRLRSAEGAGTCFSLRFPRHVAATSPERGVTVAPAANVTRRVLVVDDDPLVRRALARMVERSGYSVVEAESAEAALSLLVRGGETFDVVVTDVAMPGLHGDELARRLARELPALGVVLVSGNPLPDPQVGAGAKRRFLQKPVKLEALSAALEDVRA